MSRAADWRLLLARPGHCTAMAVIAARVPRCEWLDEARIARFVERRRSLFVTVHEEPAGFLLARPERRELHLGALVIAEPFRCRGIAGGLLRAAIIDAGNGGFDAVTAVVPWAGEWKSGSPASSDHALSLAARSGFVPVTNAEAHPRLAEMARNQKPATNGAAPVAMIRFL